MKTPEEYLNLIDRKYLEAKRNKVSRFSIEWGKWSVVMNRVLQTRIKDTEDPEHVRLGYVFIYWTLMSNLLELNFKFKLFKGTEKKRILNEASDIKEIILTGNGLQPMSEESLKKYLFGGALK